MKQQSSGFSRRRFLASAATLGAVAPLTPLGEVAQRRPTVAVDDLGLEPAVRADLERFAEPVLREAAWLEELPLDGVNPAFVFVPGGGSL